MVWLPIIALIFNAIWLNRHLCKVMAFDNITDDIMLFLVHGLIINKSCEGNEDWSIFFDEN